MQPAGPRKRHHSLGAILCMGITVFLLVLMGVITALQIYEQVNSDVTQRNRIQGFCSIPLNGVRICFMYVCMYVFLSLDKLRSQARAETN